jgi:hypothetical protein
MGKVKMITHNDQLKLVSFIIFFSEVGFTYFDNVGYVRILAAGIGSDVFAFYWLLSTIFEGFAGYYVAKYCPTRQMKVTNYKIFY